MHGLQLFVTQTPTTGTVGGIDRSLSPNAFWRNKTASVTMSGTTMNMTTNAPTPFLNAMNGLAIATTRGSDRPDLMYVGRCGHVWSLSGEPPAHPAYHG
jgi:hypothetical protein